MNILKKEYWWLWIILLFISSGTSHIFLAAYFKCFDKTAWYAKPKNWLIGIACLFLPFVIMMYIFLLEMTCKTCAKLEVPGKELYLSPVIWLVLLCIPIVGWVIALFLLLYVIIWPIIEIKNGKAEKYIEG